MEAEAQSVAALVVTYHTGRYLKDCLHALAANSDIDEIIIVNNGNPEDMRDWLQRYVDKINKAKLHVTPNNLGFGRAVNLGASLTEASQLLVINPDCVLRPDAVRPLQRAAQDLPSPWIIGGRIYDHKGRLQRGPMRSELTLTRALSKVFGGGGINLPLEPQPHGAVPMEVISGAFFLMDREGFDQLGGFDEGYFLHVEDIDLCRRAREAGGAVIYQPQSGALHYGATSNVSNLFVERHKAAGFARYFRKFASGPIERILVELTLPVLTLALFARALSTRR